MSVAGAEANDAAATARRLRWRCRRGMRELDQLLERWLDRCWAASEPSERLGFERLLACEDDKLWRWFMRRDRPDDPELDAAVRNVLAAAD